jgi:hypothetical protein
VAVGRNRTISAFICLLSYSVDDGSPHFQETPKLPLLSHLVPEFRHAMPPPPRYAKPATHQRTAFRINAAARVQGALSAQPRRA